MSAKDDFIKANENSEALRNNRVKQQATDIQEYVNRTSQLFTKIESWLEGTTVRAQRENIRINDTTTNSVINIEKLTLINGSKKATFTPDGLYYIGSQGCIELVFPDSRNSAINLFMSDNYTKKEEDEWVVVKTKRTPKSLAGEVLTEDLFFGIITPLI